MARLHAYAVAGSALSLFALSSAVTAATSTVPSPGPSTGNTAASSASGLDATFTAQNQTVEVGPIGRVAGHTPPAYNKTATVPKINRSAPIVEGSLPIPTFFVEATGIKSHASSHGIAIDSVSAEGDAAIKSVNLMINLNPLPPGDPPTPEPAIAVSGAAIASTANFSLAFPATRSVTGSASFGTLSISGGLVGHQTLTYSGSAPKNTVLYQSPTVSITLNKEMVTGAIACQTICSFAPSGITTRAIDISLNNADIRGNIVSGNIVVAESSAQ